MTFREFNALIDRYNEDQDWQNYRSAQICSVIASGLTGKEFKPADFMPVKTTDSNQEQNPDRMVEQLKAMTILLGGNIIEVAHGDPDG